ncbi:hypothetical protein D9M70_597050 [compost metagenome]
MIEPIDGPQTGGHMWPRVGHAGIADPLHLAERALEALRQSCVERILSLFYGLQGTQVLGIGAIGRIEVPVVVGP